MNPRAEIDNKQKRVSVILDAITGSPFHRALLPPSLYMDDDKRYPFTFSRLASYCSVDETDVLETIAHLLALNLLEYGDWNGEFIVSGRGMKSIRSMRSSAVKNLQVPTRSSENSLSPPDKRDKGG